MKSKIFLCLLLIVTMFACVACSNNGDGATGMLRNGIDAVENGVDRVIDDMDGNDDYGTGTTGNGKSWNDSSIKNDGRGSDYGTSDGALSNDIL